MSSSVSFHGSNVRSGWAWTLASSMAAVNCTLAPDCASLNRTSCLEMPQTCSSCLDGYIGIVGPSNQMCVKKASVVQGSQRRRRLTIAGYGEIGDFCMRHGDCLYGFCLEDPSSIMPEGWVGPDGWSPPASGGGSRRRLSNATDAPTFAPTAEPTAPTPVPTMAPTAGPMPGFCISPPKLCPSNDADLVCSGHGMCNYTDIAENLIPECNMTDVSCKANCACVDGYGGMSCSYDPETLQTRARARLILCSALLNATQLSDPSAVM